MIFIGANIPWASRGTRGPSKVGRKNGGQIRPGANGGAACPQGEITRRPIHNQRVAHHRAARPGVRAQISVKDRTDARVRDAIHNDIIFDLRIGYATRTPIIDINPRPSVPIRGVVIDSRILGTQ